MCFVIGKIHKLCIGNMSDRSIVTGYRINKLGSVHSNCMNFLCHHT
jgi:hypothetical protein